MWTQQATARTLKIGPVLDVTGLPYVTATLPSTNFLLCKNGAAGVSPNTVASYPKDGNQGFYRVALDTIDTATLGTLEISLELANYSAPIRWTMVVLADIIVSPGTVPSLVWPAGYQTVLDQLIALAVTITLSPNPDYSIGGQSVSKGAYLVILGRQIEQFSKLLVQANPYEIISQG